MKHGQNGKGRGKNSPFLKNRSPEEQKALKEARIKHLMMLIASGQYVTHITAAQLAQEPDPTKPPHEQGWGLSINYIEKLAGDAAGRLRDKMQDDKAIRVAVVTALETVRTKAIQDGKYGDAVKAILALNGVVRDGWMAPMDPSGQPSGQQVINIQNIIPSSVLEAARANEAAAKPIEAPTTAPEASATGETPPGAGAVP